MKMYFLFCLSVKRFPLLSVNGTPRDHANKSLGVIVPFLEIIIKKNGSFHCLISHSLDIKIATAAELSFQFGCRNFSFSAKIHYPGSSSTAATNGHVVGPVIMY